MINSLKEVARWLLIVAFAVAGVTGFLGAANSLTGNAEAVFSMAVGVVVFSWAIALIPSDKKKEDDRG